MSGWVAIPHAALAAVGPVPARRLAVLELYERADRLRYEWFAWTERELAEAWGTDRRTVRAVVAALESVGCVEVVRAPPAGREPSRMRVWPGVRSVDQNRNQNRNQATDQTWNQSRPAPTLREVPPGGPADVPALVPVPGPPTEPSRAEYARAPDEDQTTPCSAVEERAGARELVIAQAMALQERDEPQHGMSQPRDRRAVERAVARGVGFAQLDALWAWSGVSDDALVAGCRNGWRRWGSLLKAPQGDARLAAAWAWHVAGRPVDQRATGPPARAGPTRFSAADLLTQGDPARIRETP